jgi:hypothetical protein
VHEVIVVCKGFPTESEAYDFAEFVNRLLKPYAATPIAPLATVRYSSFEEDVVDGDEPRDVLGPGFS